MNRSPLLIFCVFLLPVTAGADVVILKDGTRLSGDVLSGGQQILIKVGGASRAVPVDQIQSIELGSPAPAPPSAPSIAPSIATGAAGRAPGQTPGRITLPAGTEIAARTIDRIDSKKADKFREYRASLDDPIVVDGVTVAPENTSAILRVTEFKNPHLSGHPMLSLALIAVVINGRRINLETDSVESRAGSRSKRTAIGAGAGAGTGAAIGAAAGGAAGAAVGAGIGAAAGTAGAALTGKGVEIPSETRFTYKLTQPVEINLREISK
jgi:hypothetical protein